jgi:hypothetical protein
MNVTIYHNPSCSNSRKALESEPRPPQAGKTVRWTVLSGERREHKRAAARPQALKWEA